MALRRSFRISREITGKLDQTPGSQHRGNPLLATSARSGAPMRIGENSIGRPGTQFVCAEGAIMGTAQLTSPQEAVVVKEPVAKPEGIARLVSLDAFRGTIMALMLDEYLHLPEVASSFPQSAVWSFIAFNTEHVPWQGCSLHDLIQPGFSFLVGAAMPFSIASRTAKGQTFWQLFRHAVWRAVFLMVLGIFLRSIGHRQTYFTFEDTLTQIG